VEDVLHDALIYARAVHFAATLTVAGIPFFAVFVAGPAFAKASGDGGLVAAVRFRLALTGWLALIFALTSGVVWFLLVAQAMSDEPLGALWAQGILGTVLLQTDFGRAWLTRFILLCALGGLFVPFFSSRERKSLPLKAATVIVAAAFVGGLAWGGHAAGGLGLGEIVHPAADILHVIAAAAWVGTLIPLALVLAAATPDPASIPIARNATTRFSILGIVSVATLLATGTVNTWYLAGSIPALTETDYGHLLLAKVALFLVMVVIAAVNRWRLTPQLARGASCESRRHALRRLRRNALVEVVLGAAIIGIVSVLGTDAPGIDQAMMPPVAHGELHNQVY
jgi:copper resistance protein D